jgi:methyl-accepting chemotaxis protein
MLGTGKNSQKSFVTFFWGVSDEIETPDERSRRYTFNITTVLASIAILSAITSSINLIINEFKFSLIVSLFITVFSTLILLYCRYLAFKGRSKIAAWLILGLIFTAEASLVMIGLGTSIVELVFFFISIIAIILLGARIAFITLVVGAILTVTSMSIGRYVPFSKAGENLLPVSSTTMLTGFVMAAGVLWLINNLLTNINRDNLLINRQAQKLSEALDEVNMRQDNAEKVSDKALIVSNELIIIAKEQSAGSQQQVAAISQATSFLQELSHTAQAIANKTEQISQKAEDVKQATEAVKSVATQVIKAGENGASAVEKAVESSNKVYTLYDELKNTLTELDRQQGQIKDVVSIIKNISDETNLLALNAAIEAAGAGQYGERFAVVAGEVKSLANSSLQASRQVSLILSSIEEQIKHAVHAVENGYTETKTAKDSVVSIGLVMRDLASASFQNFQQLDKIDLAIGVMNDQLLEINNATKQQSTASNQAVTTLYEIGEVAKGTRQHSVNITQHTQNLEELAHGLVTALKQ